MNPTYDDSGVGNRIDLDRGWGVGGGEAHYLKDKHHNYQFQLIQLSIHKTVTTTTQNTA